MRRKITFISILSVLSVAFVYFFISAICNFNKARGQKSMVIDGKLHSFLGYYIQAYTISLVGIIIFIIIFIVLRIARNSLTK